MSSPLVKSSSHVTTRSVAMLAAALGVACAPLQPVNVRAGTFPSQICAQTHPIYTVPAGKLLIIEDASASAVEASASSSDNPAIVANIPVNMYIRTHAARKTDVGSADHIVATGIGLPISGGRTLRAYAGPGTQVLFIVGGCTVPVSAGVSFSGRLVDFP
jgi:hypothetical protein